MHLYWNILSIMMIKQCQHVIMIHVHNCCGRIILVICGTALWNSFDHFFTAPFCGGVSVASAFL